MARKSSFNLLHRQWMCRWVFALALVTSTSLLLEGCGFRLRGSVAFPATFSTIAIEGVSVHTAFGRALKRALQRADVAVVDSGEAGLRLLILADNQTRRVLSVDASAKANEYELKHTVRFRAVNAEGNEVVPEQTVTTVRAYQFDPDQVLAKGDEEKKLQQEMVLFSTRQVLQRVSAAVKSHQPAEAEPQTEPDKAVTPAQ